jgi:peptidase inhibitor family I36
MHMTDRRLTLVIFLSVLVVPSTMSAQRWGRERVPQDGVCFYKDPNFQGDYFCLRGGDALSAMPEDMNDKISSMRIFGGAEVTVFRDVRFSGRSARFAGDVRKLKDEGWNDLISSVRVRPGGGSFVRPVEDVDRIIRRAYRDVLDREPDQQGLRLYRSRMLDDGWSEERVRETLRTSPEYRQRAATMTIDKAREIVRHAYLDVLKREPDPGSQGYVDKVMRDHWSQADVERELRKSDEYRNKRR